jgi:hypothetical protein
MKFGQIEKVNIDLLLHFTCYCTLVRVEQWHNRKWDISNYLRITIYEDIQKSTPQNFKHYMLLRYMILFFWRWIRQMSIITLSCFSDLTLFFTIFQFQLSSTCNILVRFKLSLVDNWLALCGHSCHYESKVSFLVCMLLPWPHDIFQSKVIPKNAIAVPLIVNSTKVCPSMLLLASQYELQLLLQSQNGHDCSMKYRTYEYRFIVKAF